jgi:hypothetical protein
MALTHELTDGLESDVGRGRRLYEWVRDEIPHSNYQSHWTCHAQSKRTFWRCFMGRRIWTLVWLWGYHGGVLDLWESNMSGPFGDISNSNRDPNDLPLLDKTYTVYHYNYQRGASEAVEDHMHQIEAVLNSVDGRDRTPPDQWDKLLFWGRFVGSDRTHKIVPPGCGWAHYPPNAEQDYDWANKRYVETDIEDWKRQKTTHELRPLGRRQPQMVRVLDAEHSRCGQRSRLPGSSSQQLVDLHRRF